MPHFFYAMPGIGDVPTLANATVENMLELAHERAQTNRKLLAELRKSIWDEDFQPQIKTMIRRWYTDNLIANLTCRHVGVTFNPGKDVLREVAVVYTHGAMRHLIGATEDVQNAWNTLYSEDAIQMQSVFANRMAMLMGTVHMVPVVRKGRLYRELKLPNVISVATDPTDPTGWPTAAIWEVHPGTNERGATDKRRVSHIVVDQHEWHYLNRDGNHVAGPDGESKAEHGATDEQGEAICPAVPLALHDRTDDYWGINLANRLHEGTIIVGALAARLSAVRSTQDHHLLVIRATDKNAVPAKQLAGGDPQKPLELFASGAGGGIATAQLLETVTDPVHHIRHIQFHVAALARANGISDDAVQLDFAGDTPVMALKLRNEQRQALRAEQIEPIRRYENRLAVVTASVTRFAQHRFADKIPPPDEVAEMMEFEVPELSTIDDPDKRREQDDWLLKNGLTSLVDVARRDLWPNRSRDEVLKLLERNALEGQQVKKIMIEHGMAGPLQRPGETPQEVRGRNFGPEGPKVRDAGSTSDDEEQDPGPDGPRGGGSNP
jgi:hypothetical protein